MGRHGNTLAPTQATYPLRALTRTRKPTRDSRTRQVCAPWTPWSQRARYSSHALQRAGAPLRAGGKPPPQKTLDLQHTDADADDDGDDDDAAAATPPGSDTLSPTSGIISNSCAYVIDTPACFEAFCFLSFHLTETRCAPRAVFLICPDATRVMVAVGRTVLHSTQEAFFICCRTLLRPFPR